MSFCESLLSDKKGLFRASTHARALTVSPFIQRVGRDEKNGKFFVNMLANPTFP